MSKSKSSSKAAKANKPDLLTKVKDAAVVKPAQAIKSKTKEIAKQIATTEEKKDKKSKKKVKEPTPEPSDSEESESSESSDSESEEETKTVSKSKAQTNNSKKLAAKQESSDEAESEIESEEDADSESDVDEKAPKGNGVAKSSAAVPSKTEKPGQNDSDSDSDSGSEVDDDAVDGAAAEKAGSSDDDSDDSSDNSSEEDEEEKKPAVNAVKRKADDHVEEAIKKTKTEPATASKGANLFVGNLSWNVDEAWLREVFEEFGELAGCRIMTDRDSGRSKGFGYVEFVNPEDAAKAHTAKAGTDLDGRTLNVDFANARPDNNQRQDNRRKSYGDQVSEPADTLFIGNLSFDVGQEAVTEAFAPHGTILGIRLPTDRETGQPKGFGYVTFASIDEAKTALEAMQGAYIENRPLRLDYSTPRPQNGDSPARGRGGFGGRGGARGGRGGRGGAPGGRGGRGGRGGGRGGSTNRGGFGDFSGRKTSFD